MAGSAPASAEEDKRLKVHPNEHFYNGDGTFNQETAKAAYYEIFDHHQYPIVPRLKGSDFWAVDFGLGNFAELGMGGIFWLNLKEENYFGHEIFLLPGQAIPEHRHVRTENAGPKLESWQVRHGWIHTYAEGETTPGVETRIPPMQFDVVKAKNQTKLMPGEVAHLAGPEQWHFMQGGDEGAIVTEYATYHDGAALRFTLPGIVF